MACYWLSNSARYKVKEANKAEITSLLYFGLCMYSLSKND